VVDVGLATLEHAEGCEGRVAGRAVVQELPSWWAVGLDHGHAVGGGGELAVVGPDGRGHGAVVLGRRAGAEPARVRRRWGPDEVGRPSVGPADLRAEFAAAASGSGSQEVAPARSRRRCGAWPPPSACRGGQGGSSSCRRQRRRLMAPVRSATRWSVDSWGCRTLDLGVARSGRRRGGSGVDGIGGAEGTRYAPGLNHPVRLNPHHRLACGQQLTSPTQERLWPSSTASCPGDGDAWLLQRGGGRRLAALPRSGRNHGGGWDEALLPPAEAA